MLERTCKKRKFYVLSRDEEIFQRANHIIRRGEDFVRFGIQKKV